MTVIDGNYGDGIYYTQMGPLTNLASSSTRGLFIRFLALNSGILHQKVSLSFLSKISNVSTVFRISDIVLWLRNTAIGHV